jgi:peptide/nickel transport system permease protein
VIDPVAGRSVAIRATPAAPVRRGGFGRLVRRYPALFGWGLATALVVLIVMAAPALSPHDPNRLNMADSLKPPSMTYPFGTDEAGRDVLSRVLHGGRESIAAALAVIVAAILIGILVGATAGWLGRGPDELLMRATELFFAFPPLVLAMAISAALGPSLRNAVIAAIVVWWPTYARLVRAEVLRVKHELFVEAGRALGLNDLQLVVRHVLPQTWAVLNARATVDVGYTILFIATLGFVGLGSRPPTAEWGAMIAGARAFFLNHWWTMTFPGLALFVTVICFSLLGDAINDLIGLRGRKLDAGG